MFEHSNSEIPKNFAQLEESIREAFPSNELSHRLELALPYQLELYKLRKLQPDFPSNVTSELLAEAISYTDDFQQGTVKGLIGKLLLRAGKEVSQRRRPGVTIEEPFQHLLSFSHKSLRSGYVKPQELSLQVEAFDGSIVVDGKQYTFSKDELLVTASCDIGNFDIQGSQRGISYTYVTNSNQAPEVKIFSSDGLEFVIADADQTHNMTELVSAFKV